MCSFIWLKVGLKLRYNVVNKNWHSWGIGSSVSQCDMCLFLFVCQDSWTPDTMTERFDCHYCKESLFGKKYILKEDSPYCVKCYENLYSNTCEECKNPIGADCKVCWICVLLQGSWQGSLDTEQWDLEGSSLTATQGFHLMGQHVFWTPVSVLYHFTRQILLPLAQ